MKRRPKADASGSNSSAMYGLVNKAVQDLVLSNHGPEAWESILTEAGVDEREFVAMDPYPDDITYAMVGAASKVLGAPADDILHAFGRHWILYTAREGYGALLDAAGSSLIEFLQNLDQLHARVGTTFPALKPPSFSVEEVEGGYALHYFTERAGLAPMVVGLLEGLAERFDEKLEIELQTPETSGHDHDVFLLRTSKSRAA